jgi:hypothetical protein
VNLDTNSIPQAAAVVTEVKAQLSPYLPALAVAAGWAGRELRNFNAWCFQAAEYVISHGGFGMIVKKLIWNPVGNSCHRDTENTEKNKNP